MQTLIPGTMKLLILSQLHYVHKDQCCKEGSGPTLALLHHRNTPRGRRGSPVQHLMGRSTTTLLPTNDKLVLPALIKGLAKYLKYLNRDREAFSKHKTLPPKLAPRATVLYQEAHKRWVPAKVVKQVPYSRLYIIETPRDIAYSWISRYQRRAQKIPPESSPQTEANVESRSSSAEFLGFREGPGE
ncbi:hypothetical protein PR048_025533 [Dryococelus australis]|uniref:Uncharacterized protein n=1 Tax=Dryococelus australis TaxID=614101 RepID=A0ABQ9GRJ9_9NEOP|nr:hypothetical protein PR048_025533 [Dryococelus australis]